MQWKRLEVKIYEKTVQAICVTVRRRAYCGVLLNGIEAQATQLKAEILSK